MFYGILHARYQPGAQYSYNECSQHQLNAILLRHETENCAWGWQLKHPDSVQASNRKCWGEIMCEIPPLVWSGHLIWSSKLNPNLYRVLLMYSFLSGFRYVNDPVSTDASFLLSLWNTATAWASLLGCMQFVNPSSLRHGRDGDAWVWEVTVVLVTEKCYW